jgi:two-component system, OmpR family, alkaline phosphatase synthesis response regulator PhoP
MTKKRILMIDDEADFLKIVKLNLEKTNKFEVLTLLCANEIISHLRNFNPDLIILDMVMPGVGGLEVCDIISKDPIGQALPILILSALDKDQLETSNYKKAIAGYLAKPVQKDELIAKIESVLCPRI